jgi:hypothetical protein
MPGTLRLKPIISLFLIIIFILPACRSTSGLERGVLITFDVSGGSYSVLFKNPGAIAEVLAVSRGESHAYIPNGKLIRGQLPYNLPWKWHIDPEDVNMAEITVELYDGLPSDVENDLDYWVDTVKRFAPWNAKITAVQDYR